MKFDDYEKEYKKMGNYYQDGKIVFQVTEDNFGPLWKFVNNNEITDVDYNGTDLWLTDINNKRTKVKNPDISPEFVEQFCQRIANIKSVDFNQKNPVVEIETDNLRMSIVHDSAAVSGKSICIRQTPPFQRITEKQAIEKLYCSKKVMSLIVNCIKAHMNIVFCGAPRAGKTEAMKFFSSYIPDNERVITIEDVMELRYKELKPKSDCVEIKCNEDLTYEDAIIASLKQNPKWIMIAETRGKEVANLIQGFSTGVNGITTLHTDDVSKIPQRMINMINDGNVEDRILNNIYEFIDVGILISIKKDKDGNLYRYIDQVAFFTADEKSVDNTRCRKAVNNGKIIRTEFPPNISERFSRAGVAGLFENTDVDRKLVEQGANIEKIMAQEKLKEKEEFEEKRDAQAEVNEMEDLPVEIPKETLISPDTMYPVHDYDKRDTENLRERRKITNE